MANSTLAVIGGSLGWFRERGCGLCGVYAWGILSYLWADYQDSSTSNYLMLGLPFLAVAIGCMVWAVRLLRRVDESP